MRPIKLMQNVLVGATASLIVGTIATPTVLRADPIRNAGSVVSKASPAGSVAGLTKEAVEALSPSVRRLSHPRALEAAFNAYFAFKASNPGEIRKPYLYFVDYGQPANAPRGYVFDMNSLKVVEGPFTVAHGSGSGSGVPTRFSNASGSNSTSLGLYTTASTYSFSGKSGGRPYASVGLRLNGKSKGFNDNALRRGVVAHGAPYVTANRAGRSQGCPALEPARAQRLLPMIANGSAVFLFAPDANWMATDRWVADVL
jgi:hypothetical protein